MLNISNELYQTDTSTDPWPLSLSPLQPGTVCLLTQLIQVNTPGMKDERIIPQNDIVIVAWSKSISTKLQKQHLYRLITKYGVVDYLSLKDRDMGVLLKSLQEVSHVF